ncbi:unnamed protein product [Periconia digitata]|uniref:Uncharacterized protein n=1 Tax=Periconia digitata TaxID=1303443 RepID=A0A9W4UDA1_9PLEO|nr:unnamed protein product [Periconia digitata]
MADRVATSSPTLVRRLQTIVGYNAKGRRICRCGGVTGQPDSQTSIHSFMLRTRAMQDYVPPANHCSILYGHCYSYPFASPKEEGYLRPWFWIRGKQNYVFFFLVLLLLCLYPRFDMQLLLYASRSNGGKPTSGNRGSQLSITTYPPSSYFFLPPEEKKTSRKTRRGCE